MLLDGRSGHIMITIALMAFSEHDLWLDDYTLFDELACWDDLDSARRS
jgi:hypothetical protein